MAQFLLLLYGDPTRWQAIPPGERQAAFAKYMEWSNVARQKGFVVGANKLVDDVGKVVRGSKATAIDGPYSETKEVLGGYYLIEADSYDEAVRLSLDHPHLQYDGTIEVRRVEVLPG